MNVLAQAMVSDDNAVNVAQNIGFGLIAAVMIFAALCVVSTKNVVHAALWLVMVLSGVAAQYILASAEFVAASQILVYIGAVMVLFLFGIMLTRAQIGKEAGLNNKGWALGIPVGLALFGLLAWVILDAFGDDILPESRVLTVADIVEAIVFECAAAPGPTCRRQSSATIIPK